MRWVEYDHEEVSVSMDRDFIHGSEELMGAILQRMRLFVISYNILK